MSKATKRKHVTREVLEECVVPTGDQKIVRVVCGRGNNLHEVETPSGTRFLVSMPTKFRRNVWIKRGDYVIVDPIAEGNKVQAEIIHILFSMQVKHLKEEKLWPVEFETGKTGDLTDRKESSAVEAGDDTSSETDSDSELFVNMNRPPPLECDSTTSESD